jgi:ribulose-phosphate 3-epimerase
MTATHKLPTAGTVELSPSILSADFSRLGQHIAQIEPNIRMLHIDVMDGHFVPNISIGPVVVKKIRSASKLFFDTHLMISDPATYAPEFAAAGSDGITFHIETVDDPAAMIKQLRDLDVAVGVTLKPATPVESLAAIIADVDMVLLMTVEPGFGGQSFIPASIDRCRKIKAMLRPDQRLEVDGGIDITTAPDIVKAGADTLVAGNAIFAQADPAAALKAIQQAAAAGNR